MRIRVSQVATTIAFVLIGCVTAVVPLRPQVTEKPKQQAALKPTQIRENPKDGLKYVWIPAGTFMMGCSPGDFECLSIEKPQHQVSITKGFWIGQTEVTVGAYKRFVNETQRHMPPKPKFYGRPLNPGWGDEAMPIVEITWVDARTYCSWAGGRLPTEAEWEYAARAGNVNGRHGDLDEVSWDADNSGRQRLDSTAILNKESGKFIKRLKDNGNSMHEVGQKRPNQFGLYDMLGNVWEWVNDWSDNTYYNKSPSQDPTGPTSGTMRVARGGSWRNLPRRARVSERSGDDPSKRDSLCGVRCVWSPSSP